MGARSPVVRGELSGGGVSELLRECERRRITGLLRFVGTGPDSGIEGTIQLFGGEIAVDQAPRTDGHDPVDLLLDLESGHWEVDLSLPPLPVSRGTALQRKGSLAVHVPVDLMSYCEKAGLTGLLVLVHEGRRAEAVYEAGELLAIELDGQDATDLHEVFAWEQGRFKITIDTDAPGRHRAEPELVEEPDVDGWSPAPATKRENTRQFLRVVEMALVDVIDRSERARSPTRSSPPLPPPPKARPRPPRLPDASRRREEQTVKLVFLSGKRSPVTRQEDTDSTRHVRSGVRPKVFARSEGQATWGDDEGEPMAKKRRKKKKGRSQKPSPTASSKKAAPKAAAPKAAAPKAAAPKAANPAPASAPPNPGDESVMKVAFRQIGGASAWAFVVLMLGVAILWVLGKLPPV